MTRVDKAVELFKGGFSCSQAMLTAFAPEFNMDDITALKVASAFGGGMAHTGETCGAVTGAFMVIGLKYGRTKVDDTDAKEKVYRLSAQFISKFRMKHSSIICKEILGHDISTEQGQQQISENELGKTICPDLVQTAAEILEEII